MTNSTKRKKNWIDFILIPFVLLLVGSFFLVWFGYLFKGIWDIIFHYETTPSDEKKLTLGFGIITFGCILLAIYSRIELKKQKKYWQDLKELYQLEPVIQNKKFNQHLTTIMQGRKFRFYERSERAGKATISYTGFRILLKYPHKQTIYILDNRWTNASSVPIKKVQQITTKNNLFDKNYKVYTSDPLFAEQILTPLFQQELNIINARFKGILKIEDGAITYESKKRLTSTKQLEFFHTMIQIVNNLLQKFDIAPVK